MKADKNTENYNRIMFGNDFELVKVENPATDIKGHGGDGCFIFLKEISGKTITQTSTKRKSLGAKNQIKPGGDENIRIKNGGFIRRKEAAKYLGISLRTLTNWQRR